MKTRRYPTLASIPYELSFADLSHFIRDLKAFSRVTPKGLADRANQFHELAGFSYEKLLEAKTFKNGTVLLRYQPMKLAER